MWLISQSKEKVLTVDISTANVVSYSSQVTFASSQLST